MDKKLDEGLALVQARVASLAVTKKADAGGELEDDHDDPSEETLLVPWAPFAYALDHFAIHPLRCSAFPALTFTP